MRWFPAIFLTLASLFCVEVARSEQEFKPIPAAEAERAVAEERGFLTDLLWVGMDGYWHAGDYEACLRIAQEVTVLDPQFVEAWTSGAWLLTNMDRDAEAEAMYKEGLAANPDSPDAYFELGFFYREHKRYDEAIAMFRQVPKYGGREGAAAHAAQYAGRMRPLRAEALTEWRAVAQRFPDDPVAKTKITRLERELTPSKEKP